MTNADPGRPRDDESWELFFMGLFVFLVILAVWGSGAIGEVARGEEFPPNPLFYLVDLVLGERDWPGAVSTVSLVLITAGLAAGGFAGIRVFARRTRKHKVDRMARHLSTPEDLAALSPKGVAASAARLRKMGISSDPSDHGIYLGNTVPHGIPLRSSWEDTFLMIAGPRRFKSSAYVIPAIIDAPGPVVATSNKRDVHDATRGVRAKVGRCWVFDPQGVADQEPEFWFNPLRAIKGTREAATLVTHFVTSTRPVNTQLHHFDLEGDNLLAYLFLTAARSGSTLRDVYRWLAQRSTEPLELLLEKSSEDDLVSMKLETLIQFPEQWREGIYGSAMKLLRCLEDPRVLRWVTPPRSGDLPEFDPEAFISSRDTLYMLSMEGEGSASPLVAALTHDTLEAAVHKSVNLPGGRLDPPLLAELDEAANVCRIQELPNLYSHFGSRGAVVRTHLQSWSQGVEVWGEPGMRKLWDSSNIRVYGGGVADAGFLGELSEVIGNYDRVFYSSSISKDGLIDSGRRQRSTQIQKEKTLDVATLSALPRGRAVVVPSGAPATVVEPVQWFKGPHAEDIKASLRRYDPAGGE
ncbi:type IV secretory system conjugative DNA transfer family protein [Streptomonospora nanhaiensis]|uniref:Type IV secretory pathway TraG/TraD family ATPase VirD4 n=1 Tax=Streptomonospora nanhaiensis TaxID=1323731 RepID=A0A853BK95_9ACTN|nr:type IV secretory system conjugative DNA transfer family protein [Streptomonospora nanhaiensis]MBV2365328.1 TraM recognition domain-containing protein [Streptomonospora nanhaiensis]MBX9389447.1 TraM recognition domain-containing protein [Streptomonospora nanhaiensis]NYI95928.1 type IV secretory pathway TraG/TraD family ATPase VirD4 [Streptomonospora nanhaiensis]